MSAKIILSSFSTDFVPNEVNYSILLPPDYDRCEKLPLLLNMHGGGLDRNYLAEPEIRSMYEKLWSEGALPPMAVACYSASGTWHLNYHDGSERWEDFAFEFIAFMQKAYNTHPGPAYNYLTGISMGSRGALRLTLKYPERFGAVAALEGVYDPVLNYADLQPRYYGALHNLPPEELGKRLGWPVDNDFYHANNHANIVQCNAEAIRKHKPKIYLECGDHDYFNAHDGAEFLHRILWENRIEHEYRLLHDCDHVGSSLRWRVEDAHRWLGRMAHKLIRPEDFDLPEPSAEQMAYLERAIRSPGKMIAPPTEKEIIGIYDEVAILAHRRALPAFITDYADTPLDGVFRKRSI